MKNHKLLRAMCALALPAMVFRDVPKTTNLQVVEPKGTQEGNT